jgi:site-specific DNA recombinase
VGIYLRMSMDRTGEEIGIDRYRSMCRAITDRHGWTSVTEYVDNDLSASKPRGPKSDYARLLADVRAGQITVVVAHDIDRLTRIPREVEDWIEMGQRGEVRLITADGEVDTFTENGRMYLRIKAAVARHEVERKGRRQRDRNQQAASKGLPPGGRRAFGYKTNGDQMRGEATAVRDAYDALLAGQALSGIAADLNAAGHRTTSGGLWRHNAVRGMLLNPRNAGLRAHKGEIVGTGTWEPIVAEETWRATVEALQEPARKTNHVGNARRWLGSRYYLCGTCKPSQTVSSTYRIDHNGATKRIYKCFTCFHSRGAEIIDEYVEMVIVKRLRRPDLIGLLAKPSPDVAPLRTQATSLRKRIDALADNVDIDEQTLARRSRALKAKLAEVEQQLADAGRGSAALAMLAHPDPGQAWLDLRDARRRQAVMEDLVESVTLLPVGTGRRTFKPESVQITWLHEAELA